MPTCGDFWLKLSGHKNYIKQLRFFSKVQICAYVVVQSVSGAEAEDLRAVAVGSRLVPPRCCSECRELSSTTMSANMSILCRGLITSSRGHPGFRLLAPRTSLPNISVGARDYHEKVNVITGTTFSPFFRKYLVLNAFPLSCLLRSSITTRIPATSGKWMRRRRTWVLGWWGLPPAET